MNSALAPLPPPAAPTSWPHEFRRFAREECAAQPVTAALCQVLAEFPPLDDWMAEVPAAQARVNLLLAAVHERVLAGAGGELAAYFPSVGGGRAPDAALPAALRAMLQAQAPTLRQHLRTRATQTNETGRCAVLRLALDAIAAHTGAQRLALFDFGASAGLNLGVDGDWVRLLGAGGDATRGPGTRLALDCDWRGGLPPPAQDWTLAARAGTDLAPIDPSDPAARRWLEACTWPDDTARLARLRRALTWGDAAVRAGGVRVSAAADGLAELTAWLPTLPQGVQPVLFNSWVLAYFNPAQRQAHRDRVQALVERSPLIALCAEAWPFHPWGQGVAPAPEPSATLWTAHDRHGTRALLWSHPHGAWARAA
ncbi:MAG: DUF2332 domain-containing protein [Inhella sp.]|uniref:DUF2332 domain-containing protein n=1 Tax=Inhella sp. TaxID=1921806 RepID=UPI0022C07264|nr:DUF2332 domain-containing protein [Inhella sp.]MCZ8236012.1 DUF2332 domain-containing protein [Inhella sp.]